MTATYFKSIVATIAMLGVTVPATAQVVVSDVTRFYRVYDAADGKPSAAVLQHEYLDAGSKGLQDFIPHRIVSAENLARQITKYPEIYSHARSCVDALATVNERTPQLVRRIKALYPAATNPRVTIVIGGANSGGTTSPEAGVILGLEIVCENLTQSPFPLQERMSYLLAHELIHTQQRGYAGDTVLAQSLNEGVAEFIGELISGHVLNTHLTEWTKGREAEIEARFRVEMEQTDLSSWLYNGVGTADKPGDLGYWVGYRIAKAYYNRAPDKHAAIVRLLEEADAKAVLRDSDW